MHPSRSLAAWGNAVLHVALLAVIMWLPAPPEPRHRRRRHHSPPHYPLDTLLTPPMAVVGSGSSLVLALVTLTVLTDALRPHTSIYTTATSATNLRGAFAVASLATTAAYVLVTLGAIPGDPHAAATLLPWAAVALLVVWLALLPIYVFLAQERLEYPSPSWRRYVFSELGLVLAFAWSSIAVLIGIAAALEASAQATTAATTPTPTTTGGGDHPALSVRLYGAMVLGLGLGAFAGVVIAGDAALGVVVAGDLVALTEKTLPGHEDPEARTRAQEIARTAMATATALAVVVFVTTLRRHCLCRMRRPSASASGIKGPPGSMTSTTTTIPSTTTATHTVAGDRKASLLYGATFT